MLFQISILILYLVTIYKTGDSVPAEKVQACIIVCFTLFTERLLRCYDPQDVAYYHYNYYDNNENDAVNNNVGDKNQFTITAYILMGLCFLCILGANDNSSTFGRYFLWRVNEDFNDITYQYYYDEAEELEDSTNNGDAHGGSTGHRYNQERHDYYDYQRKEEQLRQKKRKLQLLKYFERNDKKYLQTVRVYHV
jgi:hypothetical protein